jgi:hypothetical protein
MTTYKAKAVALEKQNLVLSEQIEDLRKQKALISFEEKRAKLWSALKEVNCQSIAEEFSLIKVLEAEILTQMRIFTEELLRREGKIK